MSTPTCRTCGTKFPGKDVCKMCGRDPHAPKDSIWVKAREHAARTAVIHQQQTEAQITFIEAISRAGAQITFTANVKPAMDALNRVASAANAAMVSFSQAKPSPEFRAYVRRVERAKERSRRNQLGGKRKVRGGR